MPQNLDAVALRAWSALALEALGQAREEIDAINVYPVADADTGTNLYLTMESATQAVDAVFAGHEPGEPTLTEAVRALAHGALIGARGNSGTILAQLLRGMAQVLADDEGDASHADGERLARALERAARSAYQAVARPVEGTVLTVAGAAAEAASAGRPAADCGTVARAAYDGACAALAATPGQLPVLGRAGVVDAGGQGLVAVLGALVAALSGETVRPWSAHARASAAARSTAAAPTPWSPSSTPPVPLAAGPLGAADPQERAKPQGRTGPQKHTKAQGHAEAQEHTEPQGHTELEECAEFIECLEPQEPPELREPPEPREHPESREGADAAAEHADGGGPAFEVIYLLEADDTAVARLRTRLDALGDSLVVVGGDGLWNVHVHVDDAGAAVEAGVEAGRPYRIRITHFGAGDAHTTRAPRPPRERAQRGIVAVVRGEGLAGLYAEAGATTVPTRAGEPPASGELVDAVRRAHAREVVLLPNGAELRHTAAAAAEQARSEGVRVALIPTRSPVQGIAALAVHEPDRRFDEDVVAMTSAAGATRYAELAVAERQSWTTAGICQAGDVLGLIDGDVAVIGTEIAATAEAVLDRMLAAGGEMVTLVLGEEVSDEVAERLQKHVRDGHLAVDTVLYRGGPQSALLLIGVE
ncbi:DAK2 domain-containing protein [Streptomyces longispororuber]|uniref:DAK2 domain-containing protein n=1 Tax=Streptomyces longispororuber TaxID=68230 RepID=UPI003701A757